MSSEPIIIPTGNGTVSLLNDILVCRDYLGKLLIRCSPQETLCFIISAKLVYQDRDGRRRDALGDGRVIFSFNQSGQRCGLLTVEFRDYSMSLHINSVRQFETGLRVLFKDEEFCRRIELATARLQSQLTPSPQIPRKNVVSGKNRRFYGFIALGALANLLAIFFWFDQMPVSGRLLHAIVFPFILIVAIMDLRSTEDPFKVIGQPRPELDI